MGGHYTKKFRSLIYEYNRVFPGPYYFDEFFSHKHIEEPRIADLGCGPVCTLGTLWGSIKITVYASDILADEYNQAWQKADAVPLIPIEYQDMENLTYQDEFFHLVHCVNALDHVKDVRKAIAEMHRVCKPGGYIYLRHARNQRRAHRGVGHFWDATIKGFSNGMELIDLDGFYTFYDGRFIVSIKRKEIDTTLS